MEDVRTCRICGIKKPLYEFYKRERTPGKISYETRCKECVRKHTFDLYELNKNQEEYILKRKEVNKIYRQKSKQNLKHWISKIYDAMRTRNRKNFDLELPFSKEEFIQWLKTNYWEKLNNMYQEYIDSGYDKYLCPSIDRINDYDSYCFPNMQLLTWRENDLKGTLSKKIKNRALKLVKNIVQK